jgi:hypothetical protein
MYRVFAFWQKRDPAWLVTALDRLAGHWNIQGDGLAA